VGWPREVVWAVVNAACFTLAMVGARALLMELRVQALHGVVYWLLALWPTLVLAGMLPEKEIVVLALLPWACCHALRVPTQGWRAALSAGLLMGVSVLVQPSLQFLAPAFLLGALLAKRRDLVGAALLACLAMALVVLPWSVRNHAVLGHWVPVSTNGGDVLYRANNDLATGVYTSRAAVDLGSFGEVARDAESKRLAAEWIVANPVRFVQLSSSKLMHFLGDDSYGAYAVFSRGGVEVGRGLYLVIRQGSGVPWLLLWIGLLGWIWRAPPEGRRAAAVQRVVVFAPVAYLALIHSVFESGPKYHLPLLVPLLVLLAALGAPAARPGR
jgi:hypothetical protein